jgi:hypothetical protein
MANSVPHGLERDPAQHVSPPGTRVVHGVLVVRGPTIRVVLIGPALTQLDTRGSLVPSKVPSKGFVSVHAKDPHNILLVLVPLINVFLMVDVEFLHTSLTNTTEPIKL